MDTNIVHKPLVSVVMPVYNASKYLREAIDSILAQDYENFEFIIINDGSTDNSEQIILSYSDSRIVYVKNEENIKLISTLNKGIDLSKGKYIARMDADDYSYPTRFTDQVTYLELNASCGLLGSWAIEFGDSQNQIKHFDKDEDLRVAFLLYNPFIHSSVMIRKSVLVDHQLLFDREKLHVEDYDLWIRISLHSTVANLKKNLVKYRVHDSQVSNIYACTQIENSIEIKRDYCRLLSLKDSELIDFLHNKKEFSVNELISIYRLDKFIELRNCQSISISLLQSIIRKNAINKLLNISSLTVSDFLKIPYKEFTVKQLFYMLSKVQMK